ncbi:hypothetical protein [Thalassotalea atypica]|uniref:hypothetical protein n=1 Tax=Thalassotalea atypica TaxID=2054316 RepID=UPI002573B364|nr:hypothetical protein [Thalassotalea atypica]
MVWDGIERRTGDSFWVKIFRVLSLIGWTLFTISLVISFYATPDKKFGLLSYHNIQTRDVWLNPLTDYLYALLWLTALFSFISIIVSHFRVRRASDDKYYNFWLLMIICVTWAIYIAIQAQT